ncbi:hypothetical protein [Piscinibacter sp.]|uniref:hypothetical protein n=1 Tax=Piscinibacter sp. TaxID=1903157 RepID=UPI0039E32751
MTQVIDLIDCFILLRKQAKNRWPRRIKQLARLWAGSAQSYPQAAWKVRKVSENQPLAGAPSESVEMWRPSSRRRAAWP